MYPGNFVDSFQHRRAPHKAPAKFDIHLTHNRFCCSPSLLARLPNMADHNNNIVNEDYLVQRLGMARILAEHTVLAIRSDDERVGTEEWLKRVPREELMSIGVEPFAADMIALFQSWLRETENADDITRGNGSLNGPLLLGGAVVGATQATAVGAAGLSAAGFGSAGVVGGSLAAAMQGPATVAGSWFALCQSAGATGAIAGPVGVAAGITAATIGLGAVALGLFVKHKIDEITRSNTENTNDEVKQTPSSVFAQVPLDVDFLMIGIQGLTMDDATRLLNRFNSIHVRTINDFFYVSPDTMHETFDDVVTQYIEKIVEYQILLFSILTQATSVTTTN